ncbi:DUF397 domain-containing protein [Streptomyces sp. NPDC014646]|uniref:DUF397 domain-containing protein n=1 Tax=Streptomyces sp. NPDC014646 TaxID=3364877 RepID=UPI0036F8F6AF
MSTSELTWFKSSYSGSQGDSCVEVAMSRAASEPSTAVHVRDSKLDRSPRLTVTPEAWCDFLPYATHG